MTKKIAFITGISGQDGSYLAELLLNKDYEVHGLVRRIAVENPDTRLSRIQHLIKGNQITLHTGDITDYTRVVQLVAEILPTEIYHLAAQSFVQVSFEDPTGTYKTNQDGTFNILEAARRISPKPRLYFAATSEMFGKIRASPQNEATPFDPASPYAISKVFGFHLTRLYREQYGLFTCCGILFNHESPRRGFEFVTRKVTRRVAEIKLGLENELVLGDPNAMRDWGYAPEYVEAMWLMLQQDKPDDFVIATAMTHSIRKLVDTAFEIAGGLKAEDYVRYNNPSDIRPVEVPLLRGDNRKASRVLGWKPRTSFSTLVAIMLGADLADLQDLSKKVDR